MVLLLANKERVLLDELRARGTSGQRQVIGLAVTFQAKSLAVLLAHEI
jgi:hypothetical protein